MKTSLQLQMPIRAYHQGVWEGCLLTDPDTVSGPESPLRWLDMLHICPTDLHWLKESYDPCELQFLGLNYRYKLGMLPAFIPSLVGLNNRCKQTDRSELFFNVLRLQACIPFESRKNADCCIWPAANEQRSSKSLRA